MADIAYYLQAATKETAISLPLSTTKSPGEAFYPPQQRAVHPHQEKQANPLQISDLEKIVIYLDKHIRQTSQRLELLPLYRNKALLLLGCGFVLVARKINCILLSESLAELSEHYFC